MTSVSRFPKSVTVLTVTYVRLRRKGTDLPPDTLDPRSDMSYAPSMKSALARVREDKGVSQVELEATSGVTERTIRRIETDPDYSPGIATLMRLADALGVELADLVLHDDEDSTTATNGHGKPHEPDTAAAKRSAGLARQGG